MGVTQRLDKLLANSGLGTRSEVRKLVKSGRVQVDGSITKDYSMHVDPNISEIIIDGQKFIYKRYIYLMMNKPAGVISATRDNRLKTVLDLLPENYRHFDLFPAGRLDRDTEGLLLLTNDGQLVHELLSPKKGIPKTYYAKVEGIVTEADTRMFKYGVVLDDGYKTMPSELNIIKSNISSEILLTIVEGKFHQVKRMFQTVGKKVVYLKRVKMGPLKLDESLGSGKFRELTEYEINLLKGDGR